MRVANPPSPQIAALPVMSRAVAPTSAEPTSEPKESFGTRMKHEIGASLISGGNDWKLAVGGAAGITTATLTTYAGIIGGALLGTVVGGGLAPMVASLGTHGVLPFLGAALATTKGAAMIGMAAGAATGMAGGWQLGNVVASLPGKAAAAVGKKMLGFDPEGEKPKDPPMLGMQGKVMQVIGTTLIGVAGAAPGLVGGAVIGGGVASAGSLVTGLLAHNVTLTSLLATGAAGAGLGALAGGTAGVWGGIAIFNSIRRGGGSAIENEQKAKEWLQLDDKDKRLTAAGNTLETLTGDLGTNNNAAGNEHNSRIANLDQRDAQIIVDNKRIEFKNANEADLVNKRATQLYDQTKSALTTREAGENDRQVHLDSEDKRVNEKRANIQNLTNQAADSLYNDLSAKLESGFQTRKGQQESRQSSLQQQEANIPNVVAQRVEATLNPLRDELRGHQNNASEYDQQAVQLQNQAQSDLASIPGIQSQASQEESAAQQAHQEANNLRPEMQNLNSEVSSERSQNESRKMDLDRREQALQAAGK